MRRSTGASERTSRATFLVLSRAFGPTFKNSRRLRRFRRGFALAGGRPSSISRLPGLIFEAENPRFSCCFAACARSVRTSSEVYKTLHWLTKIEVRAFHQRIKNDEKSRRTLFETAHAFAEGSGRAPGAVWSVLGCQLGAHGGQHGGPNGQLGSPSASIWPPETVPRAFRRDPGATRNDPERPKAAETDFSSIFSRFGRFFR